MVLLGLILTYLQIYGSSQLGFVNRTFYWVGLLMTTSLLSGPVARFSFNIAATINLNPIATLTLFSFFLAIPLFLIMASVEFTVAFTGKLTWLNIVAFSHKENIDTIGAFMRWFLQVWPVSILMVVSLTFLLHQLLGNSKQKAALPVGHLFLKRLPNELGHELICLSMEDHYIRVYTKKGQHMIHMRLKDAIKELENYDGFQTHRSWWINAASILKVGKKGRKYYFVLENDLEVPISKTFYDDVKNRKYI